MNPFLHNITPIFVICICGIIYLFIQFLIPKNDYNIFAYLVIFIIILCLGFAIDRFLVSQISYRKLFIAEIIFLTISILWYSYSISYTEINIETTNPYFFVIYKEGGLKKSNIPSKGLFSKSIVIRSDSNIYIDDKLKYIAQINPPQSWNYGFSSKGIDTVINNKKASIFIYAFKMGEIEQNQLLENEAKKLNK